MMMMMCMCVYENTRESSSRSPWPSRHCGAGTWRTDYWLRPSRGVPNQLWLYAQRHMSSIHICSIWFVVAMWNCSICPRAGKHCQTYIITNIACEQTIHQTLWSQWLGRHRLQHIVKTLAVRSPTHHHLSLAHAMELVVVVWKGGGAFQGVSGSARMDEVFVYVITIIL